MKTDQCFCQSYWNDDEELVDCTCGKCGTSLILTQLEREVEGEKYRILDEKDGHLFVDKEITDREIAYNQALQDIINLIKKYRD
jgi:hypothetical protein